MIWESDNNIFLVLYQQYTAGLPKKRPSELLAGQSLAIGSTLDGKGQKIAAVGNFPLVFALCSSFIVGISPIPTCKWLN
jgi:hypothetical protein